jgi:hypothetical protein
VEREREKGHSLNNKLNITYEYEFTDEFNKQI